MKNIIVALILTATAFAATECQKGYPSIFGNPPTGLLTSNPAFVNVDKFGIQHDAMCFQFNPTGASPLFVNAGFVITNTTGSVPQFELLSSSSTNRKVVIRFGDYITGGHETNGTITFDQAGIGNEDLSFISGTGSVQFYQTWNCTAGCATTFAPVAGTKQLLMSDGSNDATISPHLGIVSTHLTLGTSANNDRAGTLTCAGGTATYTFTTAMQNATYIVMLTDQTTAGGAKASKLAASFTVTCTGATDSVDYLVIGKPF